MGRKRDGADGQHPDRLLTVAELADRWQVHPRTIRRMIEDKKIKVIRIRRSVRIHPRVADLGPDATL